MLTRSMTTPGTVRSSAHGSRELGTRSNSSAVKFVVVPIWRESTSGEAPLTVTVSWTAATRSVTGKSTLPPTRTTTSERTMVVNP